MAIKNTEYSAERHVTYFASGVTEDGACVVMATGSYSGAALENALRFAFVSTSSSGTRPLGIIESKVVNYDLTRQKLNPFNPNEIQHLQKCSIVKNGWVNTSFISGSPNPGSDAFLAGSGYISATSGSGFPLVGRFLTGKDGNGFAVVNIDL